MSPGRRVLCVTGDPEVGDLVQHALDAAAPGTELVISDPTGIDANGTYAAAVVTDAGIDDPNDVVSNVHTNAPGLPILVAARNGGAAFASDVLVAGAASYVPLEDEARLRDRLERILDQNGDLDRFFDHLVEHVGVGVGAYGSDGIITYANPAYGDLLRMEARELRGRAVWDINPDVHEDRFDEYFESFSRGETRHADARHIRSDGETVPVHTVTTRVDIHGTPLHVGTIMDITERVETHRKIEALHEVANELADLETVSAVESKFIEAAERILDLHSSYLMTYEGDHFRISAVSENAYYDTERIPEGIGAVGQTFADQEPMLIRDAQSHPVARPSSDEFRSGISVPVGQHGVFQAVSADLAAFTEEDLELATLLATHVSAALERVAFTTALRTERDRLAALFQNVPNPVVEYEIGEGNATIATDVNPAFEEVFGYTAEEFVGRDIDETIVQPEDLDRAHSFNEDLVAGKNITAEVRRVTADGPRDFLLDVVPLEVDEANVAGYAIYTDITDQKQRERQLERQNDRLEEFASVVSHDLRNPLNVAMGRLELAAKTATDDTAEHVSHARHALDRMDDLIGDLLTLAREGRELGETADVDLATVARDAWESVDTKQAALVVEDAPTLDADVQRVRQLFENLFRNAIEHGGDDVTVTVEPTPDGFAVADDGPGIPAGTRDRIFTSGYSTSAEGTGFGLSIVERIAGAHGWRVDLEENDTGGARFRFHVGDP